MNNSDIIYLDYAATTPVDDEVIMAMLPFLGREGLFANASSAHSLAKNVKATLNTARETLLAAVNGHHHRLIWTSGATEANNLALKGLVQLGLNDKFFHIITCKTEHKSVLEPIRDAQQHGVAVTYLTPDHDGLIVIDELTQALTKGPALVSIMMANNETGVLQDIQEIGAITAAHDSVLHCDAAQAFGKTPINLNKCPIDLLTISAHKIYGPKGIGALIAKEELLPLIQPQILGGDQEYYLRAGTLPSHQIIGFAKACELAHQRLEQDHNILTELAVLLRQQLEQIPGTTFHGHLTKKMPGICNVSFNCVNSKLLTKLLNNRLAISQGSACTSENLEPSYVLRAMGLSEDLRATAVRISLGRNTTVAEIIVAAKILADCVDAIRQQQLKSRLNNNVALMECNAIKGA